MSVMRVLCCAAWLSLAITAGLAGCVSLQMSQSEPAPTPTEASVAASTPTAFPNADGALKFAVFGDFGTGDQRQ